MQILKRNPLESTRIIRTSNAAIIPVMETTHSESRDHVGRAKNLICSPKCKSHGFGLTLTKANTARILASMAILFCVVSLSGCGHDGSDDSDEIAQAISESEASAQQTALEPKTAGPIVDFLWKPKAESSYNKGMLVIHASPCDLEVYVNGEHLQDYGSGNGRCVTARSITHSGCGYGSNAVVEILDSVSGLPYTFPNGDTKYIIANGCNRVEFKQ